MSTDDLLCFYRDSSTFDLSIFHMQKFFPCASQEGPVLVFINLRTVQSKHGASFDQNSHIKNIADVYFTNPTDPLGVSDTPFQKDTTY